MSHVFYVLTCLVFRNFCCIGQKKEFANDFLSNSGDIWLCKSKFNIALKASILQAFEDNIIEDIVKIIKAENWISEEDLVGALKKNPQLLKDTAIVKKLWFSSFFNLNIMELIIDSNPQILVDEIEDFIIEKLQNPHEFPHGIPKCLKLCSYNSKAFKILYEILVQYVFETDFDTKMVDLTQKIVRKVHETSPNPILLYPIHLQPLIVLLQTDPNDQYVKNISPYMMNLDPDDAKIVYVLFSPWLKILLRNDPNFHLFSPFSRI